MHRVFRYVGPEEIARSVVGAQAGRSVRSTADLLVAVTEIEPGARGAVVCTYVVDVHGDLRLAPRSSEHVACAGGGPVLAAGELEISGGRIAWATNLSTGFCPDTSSWDALAAALDRARVARPSSFAQAFEMRRCVCGARVVIKDGVFECAECNAALPNAWNFDATCWHRDFVALGSQELVVDTVLEIEGKGEDRVAVRTDTGALVIALADGAGGMTGGADAATRVVSGAMADDDAVELLSSIDRELFARSSGESTAVVLRASVSTTDPTKLRVVGASVGDSRAWARRGGAWTELTEHQRRKPFVGSGRAVPVAFTLDGVDALLVVSDGLGSYADERVLQSLVSDPSTRDRIGHALVDAVRLPSGRLQDDVSAVVVDCRPPVASPLSHSTRK